MAFPAPLLTTPPDPGWKQLTVRGFLAQISWNGQPEAATEPPSAPAHSPISAEALNFRLSVGQFFAAIPWSGAADVLPSVQLSGAQLQFPETDAAPDSALPLELPDLDEFADGLGDAGEELTLDDFFDSFTEL